MICLFRFLLGYVRVIISGEMPQEIINHLVSNGISIWSIERRKGSLLFSMYNKDYKSIRRIKRLLKAKVKIRIVYKRGLYLFFRKFFKRKSLVLGLVILLIINIVMSKFIWIIEIDGNEKISSADIITAAQDLGVREGIYKMNIDTYDVSQKLALAFDQIAWISLNVEGSKVTINISEAEDTKDKAQSPANIVASRDGVIKSIKSTSGKKEVKIGQTVQKGEVLISGVETIGENIRYIRSKGTIIATTNRTFKKQIDKKYIQKDINYSIIKKSALEIFGFKIPLFLNGVTENNFSYILEDKFRLLGKEMPISITTRYFFTYTERQVILKEQDARNFAVAFFIENLQNSNIKQILSHKITVIENNESYIYTLDVVCNEDIGEIVEINEPHY